MDALEPAMARRKRHLAAHGASFAADVVFRTGTERIVSQINGEPW